MNGKSFGVNFNMNKTLATTQMTIEFINNKKNDDQTMQIVIFTLQWFRLDIIF